MHARLPGGMLVKRLMPRSLLGRSLLMILIPLLALHPLRCVVDRKPVTVPHRRGRVWLHRVMMFNRAVIGR